MKELKMKIKLAQLIILFLIQNFLEIIGSRILFVVPAGTKSHKIFYNGISKALASRNHQVTMISPFASTSSVNNIRKIVIPNNYVENILSNAFQMSNFDYSKNFILEAPKGCLDSMMEESVRNVLKEHFDLVIIPFSTADCYLPYIHSRKIPFIYTFPNILYGHYAELMGTLDIPSVSPIMMMESPPFPLTFGGRLKAVLLSVISNIFTYYIYNHRMEEETRRRNVYPKDSLPIKDIKRNSSLAIINSFRALEYVQKPYSGNVVFAGGIHINPMGNVSKDLQEWMDDSGDDGFILFSLGSAVKSSQMREEHRKCMLKVLSDLNLRVLWKWDGEMTDLPPNVKLAKWLPQQDILAHPKIRLFITHGGLLSTQESTYFAVPVLGMPIFSDQHNNVAQIVNHGLGKRIDWKDLSEEQFKKALNESLHDQSLKTRISQRSLLMKDDQRSPAEEVIFWVEYVLRHKGAPHIQSPLRNMSWIEVYNMDVWATFMLLGAFLTLVTTFLTFEIIYFVCNYFVTPKKSL